MNGWKGNCMNKCPCCCIAGCDRGHAGFERRMGEIGVNVQWVDQILQPNKDLKAIRTCTFLQIELGENRRGFQILGTNAGRFPSLPAVHHLPPITMPHHFPLHLYHWLVAS